MPKGRSKKTPKRDVSSRTRALFKKRSRMTRSNSSKQQFKNIQSQIKESCLKDFQDWVDKCVMEMEAANNKGDIKRVYHLVKKLSNKPKPPPSNLTSDDDGNLFKSPKDKAERWGSFLRKKFSATPAEAGHHRPCVHARLPPHAPPCLLAPPERGWGEWESESMLPVGG